MAHSRGRAIRRVPSLKTWIGQSSPVFGTDVTAAAGLFSPGLKAFGGPDSVDKTILRTRGEIGVAITSAISDEVYQFAFGVGLCTTEAALAGAVPLPFDNPEWDGWFVYQVSTIFEQYASGYNGNMVVDSKAMRKIPAGQVIFLSTQTFTAQGAGGDAVNQSLQFRGLVKTS